jgi:chromosome partitioning protein
LITLALGLAAGGAACFYFWIVVSAFAAAYEPQLKILSLVLGPVATVASIYWGYKSKQDLVDQSTEQTKEFTENATKLAHELKEQGESFGALRVQAEQAQEDAAQRRLENELAELELERQRGEIDKLNGDLNRLTEGAQELWKIRTEVEPFPQYELWHAKQSGATIVTVANLKGGVGKTTLAANLAAYASEKYGASVLLIDLDYQGSLSNLLMQAVAKDVVRSTVDDLMEPSGDDALVRVSRARVQLDPRLPRVWLVPASYSLAQLENRLLLKWLLRSIGDVRYHLAQVLLDPNVRREYKLIILDTPPRMTIGTINALVASHYLVVPTSLDRLSSEAVPQFITHMKEIRKDLRLDLELAGIAGVMSRTINLSDNEKLALERAREGGELWQADTDFVLRQTIPRRSAIADAAGAEVAYFCRDSNGPLADLFDPLFAEICQNMKLN